MAGLSTSSEQEPRTLAARLHAQPSKRPLRRPCRCGVRQRRIANFFMHLARTWECRTRARRDKGAARSGLVSNIVGTVSAKVPCPSQRLPSSSPSARRRSVASPLANLPLAAARRIAGTIEFLTSVLDQHASSSRARFRPLGTCGGMKSCDVKISVAPYGDHLDAVVCPSRIPIGPPEIPTGPPEIPIGPPEIPIATPEIPIRRRVIPTATPPTPPRCQLDPSTFIAAPSRRFTKRLRVMEMGGCG